MFPPCEGGNHLGYIDDSSGAWIIGLGLRERIARACRWLDRLRLAWREEEDNVVGKSPFLFTLVSFSRFCPFPNGLSHTLDIFILTLCSLNI
jgi:hypothetical protein